MTHRITRRTFLKQTGVAGAALGTGLWPRVAGAGKIEGVLKVGVAYVSPIAEIGWTKRHDVSIDAIKEALGDKVSITRIDNVYQPQDAERVFREMASSGHHLIFGTSFSHGTPLQKVAPRFPDVNFEHCSGIVHLENLGTFEAKYYEGTYVAGVAGGHMTESKKLGFIGGFPIPDIVGPANSMLLGARSVHPDATCSVIFLNSWYDPAKEKEAANTLVSQGCDVICSMTDTATGVQVAGQKDAWAIGYASDMSQFAPEKHLTAFMLDWSPIYVQAAKETLAGTWKARERWHGLKEGVVKMAPYNKVIPADVRSKLKQTEADIASGKRHPYAGELRDQDGNVRVPEGDVLSDNDIRSFDWFVEGMIGKLG